MNQIIRIFSLYSLLLLSRSGSEAQIVQDPINSESVYLHTDRNIYIAGEFLFYTLYLKGNQDLTSKYCYLQLNNTRNATAITVRAEMKDNISYGALFLPDTLSTGIYQITCYTNLMRNRKATFFKKELVIANRFDENPDIFNLVETNIKPARDSLKKAEHVTYEDVSVILNKTLFSPGEKISFSLNLKNDTIENIGSLSVSVSEIIPGLPAGPVISDYLSNRVKNDSTGFSGPEKYDYLPEFFGTILQGRVIPKPENDKIEVITNEYSSKIEKRYFVFLSAPDSIANLQYTKTDSTGLFNIRLNPYYEGKEVIIKLKEEADAVIEIDDKTETEQTFFPSKDYRISGLKDFLLRSSKIVQVQRFYGKRVLTDTLKSPVPVPSIPAVYFKHYLQILPADYIELPDFIEISREILPSFKVRKTKESYNSEFSNIPEHSEKKSEPALFLDGVPIDNVGQIILLGSKDIKSIELAAVIRYYGEISFNGILALRSFKNKINDIRFSTANVKYRTFLSQEFVKTKKFTPERSVNHIPDVRQLLLWEPELKPEGNYLAPIEFYASDLRGQFRINIQGILKNGKPVNGSAIISVR